MKIKLEGEMTIEKTILAGMKFGEWTEVEMEIVPEKDDGVRLTFSGFCKRTGGRRDMARIHIDENGVIAIQKPIIRPTHDHDDHISYCELRGVTVSWGDFKRARTEMVSNEAVTIITFNGNTGMPNTCP